MPLDLAPAQIAFGEVRHARHRPTAHAFRYPAYFLRLPMRRLDAALAGQRLLSHNRFNLMSFHDADHGDPRDSNVAVEVAANIDGRSHGSERLLAWIARILDGEGISDARGEIWLHTFPRVLGYAFKPVSFWFCHREDGALRAIVCEINNTFGERHCYLLAHRDGRAIVDGEELAATKVFHVSPFCTTSGVYRFRFLNARNRAVARIEYDDAHNDAHDDPCDVAAGGEHDRTAGPLISTSLSGALAPVSNRALLSAFVSSPLFSFGVIARIHWQAVRLWIKRTPLFSKPAPPTVEVSR
ncbi:MAG: DUF1365 domain-containing protein [Burkholderiaceae bacterium]